MLNRQEKEGIVVYGFQLLTKSLIELDAKLKRLPEFAALGIQPDSLSGLERHDAKAVVSGARRKLAKVNHPDLVSNGSMSLINQAADNLLAAIDNGNHTG